MNNIPNHIYTTPPGSPIRNEAIEDPTARLVDTIAAIVINPDRIVPRNNIIRPTAFINAQRRATREPVPAKVLNELVKLRRLLNNQTSTSEINISISSRITSLLNKYPRAR